MNCPHCNHPKIIVDYRAPIGGCYIDENGAEFPRLRCESCRRSIVMAEVNPTRPVKPRRDTLKP